ncbi:hypothetical protein EUGRSUZ_K01514 [Eucalyptus grandis]|uniref:Uncharacterized protein n=2 Tax=Eucalyptus grandis TaxID=71139 RepID=A0A059A346_EUCGR|nr:hypothetical protein EUGRSUZ_K01514 [Eucalyptus grandis]
MEKTRAKPNRGRMSGKVAKMEKHRSFAKLFLERPTTLSGFSYLAASCFQSGFPTKKMKKRKSWSGTFSRDHPIVAATTPFLLPSSSSSS